MQLEVRYFGGLRERLGADRELIEVEAAGAAATVDDLWRALIAAHPQLEGMRGFVRVAVNLDFAEAASALAEGDEVALIPPVSGGAGAPGELSAEGGAFLVTRAALEAEEVERHVRHPAAGALVLFKGVVRDHTGPRDVSYLEYDIYLEMALQKLRECAAEVRERWAQVRVAIHHRWGRLEIGEAAVIIAVSSPHRKQAFLASEYAIDRLKEIVPVWKKEVGPDGEEWIGMGP